MVDSDRNQFLWVEKYRPKTIDECVLPEDIKKIFLGILQGGKVPNLLLAGPPGSGKTTVAKALCEQLDADYLVINGSMDGNIDTLRTTIKSFASAMSFGGNRKVVILDEADYLNPQSTQPALRNFIEEFADNCGFIFTCNFKNKIIEPLHSRCSFVEFRISKDHKRDILEKFYKRVLSILDNEKITYNKKVVADLIVKNFPDFRRVLNELQKYSSASGEINEGILVKVADLDVKTLYKAMKEKNYNDVRAWVAANLDNDPVRIYRKVYDALSDHLKPTSIPQAVMAIGDWEYKNAFSADPEIPLLCCLTEILVNCEFL